MQTPSGDCLDATPVEGTLIVNVGDMLHRMSNGRLISTPHRVTNATGRECYSLLFFFDPHVATEIAPLASTGAQKFDPFIFADFLRSELEAGYDAHQDRNA